MAGFLEALKSRCDVVELDGGRDWRRGTEEGETRGTSWFDAEDDGFEEGWRGATGASGGESES